MSGRLSWCGADINVDEPEARIASEGFAADDAGYINWVGLPDRNRFGGVNAIPFLGGSHSIQRGMDSEAVVPAR